MTWRTSEDLKNEVRDIAGRFLRGLVRRFAITLTDGTKWRFSGMRSSSGGDETPDLEVFPGVGIYARPPSSGGNPEAIAIAVGGAKHRVAIATRDEATRQAALADDVQPDETCVYNGSARVYVKAGGMVEIRLHGGTTEPSIMGQTYRSAEDTMLTALKTCLTAISAYAVAIKGVADPSNTATPTLTTAITACKAAIDTFEAGASSYLTTVLKVQ